MLAVIPVDSSLTSSKNKLPVAVERYDGEVREYYDTERADRLNFRIVDALHDHRFYHEGRPDSIKEIVFSMPQPSEATASNDKIVANAELQSDITPNNKSEASSSTSTTLTHDDGEASLHILYFKSREDGMLSFTRTLSSSANSSEEHTTYRLVFDETKRKDDGLRSISLALRQGARIDVTTDTPSTVFGSKTLHLALECNPDVHPAHVMEVYEDQQTRTLRLTVEDQTTLLKKTRTFANDEPNDDELYESNKVLLMHALVKIVNLEREVYLNAPLIVDVEEQKRRLERLSVGLFHALDDASPALKV